MKTNNDGLIRQMLKGDWYRHLIPCLMLTGLITASMQPAVAATQLSMPISGKNLQGVQQVELNLAAIAAANASPQHLYVIDANQQIMPMRIDHPVSAAQRQRFGLQLYRWPSAEVFHNSQSLRQLQLQLKQGEQQATVVFPDQPDLNLSQQGKDQTWLLVSPELPQALSVDYLELNWSATDFFSQVQVEGSNNLVDWQFAGLGQILQTKNSAGEPLLQQRIKIDHSYAYWRIRFDQPLNLQQASLSSAMVQLPLWQQQDLNFQKVADTSNQWQLTLPYALAIQKVQFNIPDNQLWTVNVESRQYRQGHEYWHAVANSELYRWQKNQQAGTDLNPTQLTELNWNLPVASTDWRLTIQAPAINIAHTLTVSAFAPKTSLLFLAQGRAPYQLLIDASSQKVSPSLPQHLKAIQIQQLGRVTSQEIPVSGRQYGLWAGLVLLVSILAFAAWRLFKAMQAESAH